MDSTEFSERNNEECSRDVGGSIDNDTQSPLSESDERCGDPSDVTAIEPKKTEENSDGVTEDVSASEDGCETENDESCVYQDTAMTYDSEFSAEAESDADISDTGADASYEYSSDRQDENGADGDSSDGGEDVGREAECEPATYEVISVRFKKAGKDYYFDAAGEKYSRGDSVIVETSRGIEYGSVICGNRTVSEKEVVLPLRPVIRRATERDEQTHRDNLRKEIDAYNACVEKISQHGLDMKLVDVEYTFDNSKLTFYFTAEGRVDFRELVKDLASMFRTRIELRQIGIRDEAKLMGGLGICGRPFCCHSFLSDFVQVSIKMAKEQNLSLNSSKTSGACGRLMCCLRYEYDVYCEEIKKTPKLDSVVLTPDGEGIVKETMPLTGKVRVEIRNKNNTTVNVYSRDDVTTVQGKTAKEYIAEKNSELETLEASRPEPKERPERKPVSKHEKAATIEEAETRREERALQARRRVRSTEEQSRSAEQRSARGGESQGDGKTARDDKESRDGKDRSQGGGYHRSSRGRRGRRGHGSSGGGNNSDSGRGDGK